MYRTETRMASMRLPSRSRDNTDDANATLILGIFATIIAFVGIVLAFMQLRHVLRQRAVLAIFELE
jgi:hypothetical protein